MKNDSIREEHIKKTLDQIKRIENCVDKQMFNTQQEQKYEINIKVDNTISHGVFVPSKVFPGQWRASEQTFRAMKKDIFALGNSEEMLDEIAQPYKCHSCQTNLDKQFWKFCPYCGELFLE
jgi:hypothetical protein